VPGDAGQRERHEREEPDVSGPPHRARFLLLVVALVVALVAAPTLAAWADTADPTSTTTAPAEGTNPATPAPDPATTDPATTDPAATDPVPTNADPTADPTASAPATDGTTSATEAPPAVTTSQDATVDNGSTGVANSGANTATGVVPDGGDTTAGNDKASSHTSVGVVAGSAGATGGASTSGISQTAVASATEAAHVFITQLALIVNIGLALASSGSNDAAATDQGTGQGVALVDTGSANVTGLAASTAVTQVVHLLDANEQTQQNASAVNIGVGVGNSGANQAVGQLSAMGPDGAAVAVTWGPSGTASVASGSATATGDQSNTTIIQVAVGTAADDGTLQIVQRAVVVNFGAGLASSGANAAGALGDNDAMLTQAIVLALLSMLLPSTPSSGAALAAVGVPDAAGGQATVRTGSAIAVGNDSTTTIRQTATGAVTGSHSASADQSAAVGNFGVGIANTGGNGAAGIAGADAPAGAPADAQAGGFIALSRQDFDAVTNVFASFLALLADPQQQADWNADLQLGRDLLAASASIAAVEALFTLPLADGSNASVVIRQITGILNLSIALATSGANTATTDTNSARAGAASVNAAAVGGDSAQVQGQATIHTGDVQVANLTTTVICQVIDARLSVCAPPEVTPPSDTPPSDIPATVEPAAAVAGTPTPAQVAPTQEAAAPNALAFTGASSLSLMLGVAFAVLLTGLVLLLVANRRRVSAGNRGAGRS
jgi:hypothetical protein